MSECFSSMDAGGLKVHTDGILYYMEGSSGGGTFLLGPGASSSGSLSIPPKPQEAGAMYDDEYELHWVLLKADNSHGLLPLLKYRPVKFAWNDHIDMELELIYTSAAGWRVQYTRTNHANSGFYVPSQPNVNMFVHYNMK